MGGNLSIARRAILNPVPGKIRFGVLGTARIALQKVIPAMQASAETEILAIASRQEPKAREAAERLGIPKFHSSYEALLTDPEIDAVYNPLPNHLHVEWSVRAAAAGKHVLCEKPIGLSAAEAGDLIAARDRYRVTIAEAFMIRCHPQWRRTKEIVDSGEIGPLRAVVAAFSYFNTDPNNIRNRPEMGGGALMDIGCYPIHASRYLFGEEPRNVCARIERDPTFGTDILTSAILNFPRGHCLFTCSTQMNPYQRMQVIGTKGRVEIEIPFNAPPDAPTRIAVDLGGALDGSTIRVEEFPAANQYRLQGEAFAAAVRGERPVPVPLEDSLANMQTTEAILRADSFLRWEAPGGAPLPR
jgi:predicted dehydrogenase